MSCSQLSGVRKSPPNCTSDKIGYLAQKKRKESDKIVLDPKSEKRITEV
jgi:hypothetical protein